jgi:hypothetical protein
LTGLTTIACDWCIFVSVRACDDMIHIGNAENAAGELISIIRIVINNSAGPSWI